MAAAKVGTMLGQRLGRWPNIAPTLETTTPPVVYQRWLNRLYYGYTVFILVDI